MFIQHLETPGASVHLGFNVQFRQSLTVTDMSNQPAANFISSCIVKKKIPPTSWIILHCSGAHQPMLAHRPNHHKSEADWFSTWSRRSQFMLVSKCFSRAVIIEVKIGSTINSVCNKCRLAGLIELIRGCAQCVEKIVYKLTRNFMLTNKSIRQLTFAYHRHITPEHHSFSP